MRVETFECQETAAEPIEASEEAIEIINKLGLKGQQSLVSKNEESGRQTRCPYRLMTQEELFVYATLCPKRTVLTDYEDGPIPLRVLQIGAHAAELELGKQLEVWHRAVPEVKDPVLVASNSTYIPSGGVHSFEKFWILARWGEELDTFAILTQKAADIVRERLVAAAEAAVNSARSMPIAELVKLGPGAEVAFRS